VMARIGCILLCAIASAIIAFLLVAQAGAKRTALAKSTVYVHVGKGHGSGVAIGNRYILTAAHVVGAESEVMLSTSNGGEYAADVLWANRAHDVALLRFREDVDTEVSRLNCSSEPAIGQHIEAIGSPGIFEFVHSWGRISKLAHQFQDWKVALVADLNIAPGSSGGPVIDERGRVIGIVVAWYPPTSFSIIVPSSAICYLLARNS